MRARKVHGIGSVMKPQFALSLSFDGIRLLHRAAGGWRLVGTADVGSADLSDDLARLRAQAEALAPGAVQTKLIIPGDQIKYMTLDTGAVGTPARLDAARAALDGATPYAVDELAFDICEDGAVTHVAAVAKDTLDEAEAFAKMHNFAPLCAVAIPENAGFLGEPFFGVTQHSSTLLNEDQMVEPDGIAVVEIGPASLPPSPDLAPPEPEAAPVSPEGSAPVAAPQADQPPAHPPEAAPAAAEAKPKPQLPHAAIPGPEPKPKPEPEPQPEPEPPQTAPPPVAAALPPAPPRAQGFASRRAAAPPLTGATRQPPAAPPSAPAPDIAPATPSPAAPAPDASAMRSLAARSTQFLSRRRKSTVPPAPASPEQADEARRMTVFGARSPAGADVVGGKPRFLGLILTAILLVFLAGIAAWASVFLDDGLARLLPRERTPQVASLPQEALPQPEAPVVPDEDTITVAALDPAGAGGLTEEDAAVLEALSDARPEPEAEQPPLSQAEAEARYAVTGIWPIAPVPPSQAPLVDLDNLYVTSIDPVSPAQDAILLPARASLETDEALAPRAVPAPPGTRYATDAQGRIVPTPEGVQTPDGFTLFAGRPPVEPPAYPVKTPQTPLAETEAAPDTARLAAFRPQARPSDLVEQTERATLGGLTRSELAELRPRLRPVTEKEEEEAEAQQAPPSDLAIAASFRPETRPRNMERIVARATRTQPEPVQTAAAVAPRTVTPNIPSSANVSRAATERNVLNLNRVNLIGVYGTPSARRALVRLGNGRYRKVKVGDRIDGGRVSAIGESELRYRKGNRNLVLKMPTG